MGEPDDEDNQTPRPEAPPGWRVISPPERRPDPGGDEIRELLRAIQGRQRGPAAPKEADDSPDAA